MGISHVRGRNIYEETFKSVHEKLVAEGIQCEASEVKKACNKASKRGHTGIVDALAMPDID